MKKPKSWRKRLIPYEIVDISGDELIYRNDELLVTRWKAIKPRQDFSGGISYTFIKDGYKISKFFNNNGEFIYWYCDIIEAEYDNVKDEYIFTDLLLDIKFMPDGAVKVLDADELAVALEEGLISQKQACIALKKLNELLQTIYEGTFPPEVCRKEI